MKHNPPQPPQNGHNIEYWLVLLALCLLSICYYGIRAAAVMGLAAVTAILTDLVCLFLRGKSYKAKDLPNIGNALLLVLLFPATIPYSIVILSTVFTVAVGTHVFGSRKDKLFPPAALGYLFALLSWREEVLSFPKPGVSLALFGNADVLKTASHSHLWNSGTRWQLDLSDLLLGDVTGPMGTGCLLLLGLGGLILLFRRRLSSFTSMGMLLGVVLMCLFTGRRPEYALCANMILFSAIFLAGDRDLTPARWLPALIGGLVIGVFTEFLGASCQLEYAPIVAIVLASPLLRTLRQWDAKSAATVPAETEVTP